jgi:hypothetical protein
VYVGVSHDLVVGITESFLNNFDVFPVTSELGAIGVREDTPRDALLDVGILLLPRPFLNLHFAPMPRQVIRPQRRE